VYPLALITPRCVLVNMGLFREAYAPLNHALGVRFRQLPTGHPMTRNALSWLLSVREELQTQQNMAFWQWSQTVGGEGGGEGGDGGGETVGV